MPYTRISIVDKERLITEYENGNDYQALARSMNIGRTTAYSIVRRYLDTGEVARPRGGFRGRKMSEDMINAACSIVEDNNALTLNQINEELRHRLPNAPQVTISTLSSALRVSQQYAGSTKAVCLCPSGSAQEFQFQTVTEILYMMFYFRDACIG